MAIPLPALYSGTSISATALSTYSLFAASVFSVMDAVVSPVILPELIPIPPMLALVPLKLPAVIAPVAVTLVRPVTSFARLIPSPSTTMFPFSLAFAEIVSPVISMPFPAVYSGISKSPMAVVTLSSTYFLLVASVSPVMDSVASPVIFPLSTVTPSTITLPPVMAPVVVNVALPRSTAVLFPSVYFTARPSNSSAASLTSFSCFPVTASVEVSLISPSARPVILPVDASMVTEPAPPVRLTVILPVVVTFPLLSTWKPVFSSVPPTQRPSFVMEL